MRNIVLVALLIAFATLVGCKDKASQPAESTMDSSMDTQSMEKPKKEDMQQSSEAMQDPAATGEMTEGGDGAAPAQ